MVNFNPAIAGVRIFALNNKGSSQGGSVEVSQGTGSIVADASGTAKISTINHVIKGQSTIAAVPYDKSGRVIEDKGGRPKIISLNPPSPNIVKQQQDDPNQILSIASKKDVESLKNPNIRQPASKKPKIGDILTLPEESVHFGNGKVNVSPKIKFIVSKITKDGSIQVKLENPNNTEALNKIWKGSSGMNLINDKSELAASLQTGTVDSTNHATGVYTFAPILKDNAESQYKEGLKGPTANSKEFEANLTLRKAVMKIIKDKNKGQPETGQPLSKSTSGNTLRKAA